MTFQLEGEMASEGGTARLRPGDVEWTTAGSGIVHGPEHEVSSFEQVLPTTYSGFAYVLAGEARVGSRDTALVPGQVGWLDRPTTQGDSLLVLANHGPVPMRLLLYAGERQNVPLATHGPFIGETREDIVRSMKRYATGSFRRY